MKPDSGNKQAALQVVLDYHRVTKHGYYHFANGPGYLDWETQPNPFRRYHGTRLLSLDQITVSDQPLYDEVFVAGKITRLPLNRHSISRLFFDSLAISAWKVAGESRWSLRVNPSSGNLHPTEAYLICGPVEGLCDTPVVSHYAPLEHGLEVLATFDTHLWEKLRSRFPEQTLFVALTSIAWREAWKYGQRAWRYCQHDVGHAIAAVSLAAAGSGWQARMLDDLGNDELALLTGTFRKHDAEVEEPDVLIALYPADDELRETGLPTEAVSAFRELAWQGSPNALSPSRIDWGMDEIAAAVRKPRTANKQTPWQDPSMQTMLDIRPLSFRQILRQRRSAVAMDGVTSIPREVFFRLLQKTLPRPGVPPFNALASTAHIHLVIFVHRVDGLAPGLYCLVRDLSQRKALAATFTRFHAWHRVNECPQELELYCLMETDARQVAQQISCTQAIAGDGCFSLGMIAEFRDTLENRGAWFYSHLFHEAGVIGQILYLEAEAAGVRGTGIGCYFDDAMHDLLGLKDNRYQDLYHFTIGGPVEDVRLKG